MATIPSDERSDAVNRMTGCVVQLDREKCEGRIRLEGVVGPDLPFDRSVIALDDRYIGEIIIGVEFCCDVAVDGAGVQKILKMTPPRMMVFDGFIREIRRLEGVAEVSPNFLDTAVVFSRVHLDDADNFQKLRVGDKVRIQMEFYNLISKRKPPRATRVILLHNPNDSPCGRLRPALRRSNSLSSRPSISDREEDTDEDFNPRLRSSSQENLFSKDAFMSAYVRRGFHEYEPDFTLMTHDRRPCSPFEPPPPPPASFYSTHGYGPFPAMSSPAAWMAQRSFDGMPLGPRSLPIGVLPNAHGVHRHHPFLHTGGMLGTSRCASTRFPQAPPFPYIPHSASPDLVPGHEPNARWNHSGPSSNTPANVPPNSMNDSDVVLEMTVDELRRLILEQPRVRSPDQNR